MAVLAGEYYYQLDAKLRMRMPAKLKAALGDNPFIMQSDDSKSLTVLPTDTAEAKIEEMIEGSKFGDKSRNDKLRRLMSQAMAAEYDANGRIMLPQRLLDYAGITKNMCIVGVLDHVEIWDEDSWKEYSASIANA